MARSLPARPARPSRAASALLALVALLVPAAAVTGLAAPAYASSEVCGTPLADLLGQDCTAPIANVYRAKADHGYQDLMKNPETTSDNAEFFLNTQQTDPDGDKVTFTCRLTRGGTVVKDWADCTYED